jgi:hypothetical protein
MHTSSETPKISAAWTPLVADAGSAARVAPDGTVAADVGCRRCGYNLRTLHVDAACPECASPVAASVNGDALMYSDPSWLAKVTLGADLRVFGWVALLPTVLLSFIFAPIRNLVGSLTAATVVTGTWLLTRPDPSGSGEPEYGRSRRLARVLPFAALTAPLWTELRDSHPIDGTGPDLAVILLGVASYAAQVAALAALTAMLLFIRSFAARRIRDDAMAQRAHAVFGQFFGAGAVFLLLDLGGALVIKPGWFPTGRQ